MRYALRVDANQSQVISALEAAGAKVQARNGVFYPLRTGAANANFKNAGHKVCEKCGKNYHSYQPERKYCSQHCYNNSRQKPLKKQLKLTNFVVKKLPVVVKKPIISFQFKCIQCGESFRKYPSQTRVFCSYKCHLDSGGAQRAGDAAARSKMKYGAKKDANHHEIVDVLEGAGAIVFDASDIGGGFPDLICGINGKFFLVEIKNPKTAYGRRGLNKRQQKWHEIWQNYPICLVDSPECALRHLRILQT